VVEAAQSFLPLLIVTADRPLELGDVGAPQSMDQLRLYGNFARGYVELGHPEAAPLSLDALERRAAQAVLTARGPVPGPVQINARARKPLEPKDPNTPEEQALSRAVDARLLRPRIAAFLPERTPDASGLRALETACRRAPRGLLVAGPQPVFRAQQASALFELARATGYPVCVETTSQARSLGSELPKDVLIVGGVDALFAPESARALNPDLVLVFGAPPTSSALANFLRSSRAMLGVVTEYGWLDPSNRAEVLVQSDPSAVARALSSLLSATGKLPDANERQAFSEQVRRAELEYWKAVERVLRIEKTVLTEAVAVRIAIEALPPGGLLGVGNSLPVRDVDAFVPPGHGPHRVWSQRGVNGIDGLVSAAAGAANAARVPSLVLLGDVSFFHDLGGLACMRGLKSPLALTVIDNGGGRIFGHLPLTERFAHQPELEHYWLTPPGLDLGHAAALFGIPYARAQDALSLERALCTAFAAEGCTLIHALVEPKSAYDAHAAIQEQLAAALASSLA
jgi:2-succinyl-5-enolpyruvyl-6-hydroxy-3-cyclohexene-1-carboxylate synthase